MNQLKSYYHVLVEAFMRGAGQTIPDKPVLPADAVLKLRCRLILEEAVELIESMGFHVVCDFDESQIDVNIGYALRISSSGIRADLPHIAKESADLLVVTLGAMSACGLPDLPIMDAVCQNNLLKLLTGTRDPGGKLIKAANHPPVPLVPILKELGWNDPIELEEEKLLASDPNKCR